MNDIEELTHILDVLRKHNLPISSTLEKAIKEKIECLSSSNRGLFCREENREEKCGNSTKQARKKSFSIRVIRPNGTQILGENSSCILSKVIKEIGVELVYNLRIPLDGMFLVTKGVNPQYPMSNHELGNGYYVNVHSNTITKKRQLERIFKSLNIDWKVDIVESDYVVVRK